MPNDVDHIELIEFLDGKRSICREERQYALLLYNILRDMKNISIDSVSYAICEVYFEVSFLRDYFEAWADKTDFNKRLIRFSRINAKIKTEQDPFNLDDVQEVLSDHVNGWSKKGNKKNKDIWESVGTKLPQYLMNAQPDIGMILSPNENESDKKEPKEYYLCFIECKYCSSFSKYPSKGKPFKGEKKYEQIEVQKLIAEFLCCEDSNESEGKSCDEEKIRLEAEYNRRPLMPLKPRCTMVAWFDGDNAKPKKTHLETLDNTETTPKLGLDILIPNSDSKNVKIVNGQLEFEH